VAGWLAYWLEHHPGAASTVEGYASHARLYLEPLLGHLLLTELSVAYLEEMFAVIKRGARQVRRRLSDPTVNRIRATLRTALNAAIREGLVEENPAALVKLRAAPRTRAVVWTAARVRHWRTTGERPRVAVWTAALTTQFLNAIRAHRLYAAYRPPDRIARTAARGNGRAALERRGPRRRNGGDLPTVEAAERAAGGERTQDPHSHRVIALDHTTVAALRARRKRQCAEQRAYGDGYHDSGYIFTNLDGTSVSSDRLSNTFRLLVVEHDVPPIRLHDLRHGAATLALAAGVELKVVQEMLGHGSIVVTADTYTSVLPEVAHRAAEKTAAHVLRHAGMVPGTTRRCRTAPASRKIAMPRKTKIRFARRLSARAGLAKMAHQHPRINPPG
jgi:integrase